MGKKKELKEGEVREARISVDIRDEVLRAAIALKHRREKAEGMIVTASEIVREAVMEKFEREIKDKD